MWLGSLSISHVTCSLAKNGHRGKTDWWQMEKPEKKKNLKKRERALPRRWQAVEKSKSGERHGEIYGVSK